MSVNEKNPESVPDVISQPSRRFRMVLDFVRFSQGAFVLLSPCLAFPLL